MTVAVRIPPLATVNDLQARTLSAAVERSERTLPRPATAASVSRSAGSPARGVQPVGAASPTAKTSNESSIEVNGSSLTGPPDGAGLPGGPGLPPSGPELGPGLDDGPGPPVAELRIVWTYRPRVASNPMTRTSAAAGGGPAATCGPPRSGAATPAGGASGAPRPDSNSSRLDADRLKTHEEPVAWLVA